MASIDDLKQALVSASFDLGLDVNACRNGSCQKIPFVNGRVISRAVDIVNQKSTVPVEPEPIELDIQLPKLFGWDFQGTNNRYGFAVQFNLEQASGASVGEANLAMASTTGVDSYKLSFEAYDIDYDGELKLYINGEFVEDVAKGANNVFRDYQITLATSLLNSGSNTIEFRADEQSTRWAVRNLLIEEVPSFPDLPDSIDRLVGDNGPYGNAYSRSEVTSVPVNFSFSQDIPTATTFETKEVRRDVLIKFIAKAGGASSADNGTLVKVNGNTVLTTPFISGDEQSFSVVANRNQLIRGANIIEFSPRDSGSNATWGVRAISIEYIESVSLTVGAVDVNEYGYQYTPSRFTGLRASFDLATVSNDYELSLTGWDIDVSSETTVYLNGTSMGLLTTSSSSAYTDRNSFVLLRSQLRSGENQIELVQRYPGRGWTGFEDEKWAVKDIQVKVLKPDLKIVNADIIDPVISPGVSFAFKTSIQNGGVGSSDPSTVRFLVSVDQVISSADTLLGTVNTPSIGAGSILTIENNLSSNLANQGYYIGVCVDVVPNEVSNSNNCSAGRLFESKVVMVPIIMLLLGDD